MTDTTRIDIYSRITNRIIADLEQGTRPWHRPWSVAHAEGRIVRLLRHSGIPYQGISVVMLWSAAVAAGYLRHHRAKLEGAADTTWLFPFSTAAVAAVMSRDVV